MARSASAAGVSIDWMAATSSAGACGSNCTASSVCARRLTNRASISGVRGSARGSAATRATRNGQPLRYSSDLEALLALADEMMRAVRRGDVAHDVGDRAHAVHVDRGGIGDVGRALHQNADLTLVAHRLLRGGDRLRPAERERQHQAGKQHGVAHRHDDERVRRQWRQRLAFFARSARGQHFEFSHGSLPLSAM